MSIDLNQKNVDKYINAVLDAFREGKIDQQQALADLAQALTMAAIDNSDDLKPYILATSIKQRWKIE